MDPIMKLVKSLVDLDTREMEERARKYIEKTRQHLRGTDPLLLDCIAEVARQSFHAGWSESRMESVEKRLGEAPITGPVQ